MEITQMVGLNNESLMWMGAFVAMAVAMVRLAEIAIGRVNLRIKNGNSSGRSIIPRLASEGKGLTPEEHAALMRLDEAHDRYDQDGTPLWYVPRSLSESFKDMVKTQQEIAERLTGLHASQKAMLKYIEKLESNTSTLKLH